MIFQSFMQLLFFTVSAQALIFTDYSTEINKKTMKVELGKIGQKSEISFEKLKNKNIQSYDEFLGYIDIQAPTLFDQAVLIHSSGSLQHSTPKSPRVLLFNKNQFLSLSGEAGADQRVEIIEFNPDSYNFEFKEIIFGENSKPKFVENPTSCKSCHGHSLRPVWEPYDFWPTAFFSRGGGPLGNSEKKTFESFKENNHKSRILKKIKDANFKTSLETFTYSITQMGLFNKLNSYKKQLKEGSLFPFRYFLLGATTCFPRGLDAVVEDNITYKEYLPKHVIKQFPIHFETIFKDIVSSNQAVKDYLFSDYLSVFPDSQRPTGVISLERLKSNEIIFSSQVQYVFKNLGFDLRQFTTDIRKDNYIISTPSIFELDFQKALVHIFPEILDDLSVVSPSYHVTGGLFNLDCDELKKLSYNELKDWAYPSDLNKEIKFTSYDKANREQSNFGKCISCHVSARNQGWDEAPFIPFHNTFQLRKLMETTDLKTKILDRITRKDSKRMPMDFPALTAEEIKSFTETLDLITQ